MSDPVVKNFSDRIQEFSSFDATGMLPFMFVCLTACHNERQRPHMHILRCDSQT